MLELDWYAPLPPDVPSGGVPQGGGSGGPAAAAGGGCRFQQWKGDSAALLRDVRVVFAADVIYDDDLTGAAPRRFSANFHMKASRSRSPVSFSLAPLLRMNPRRFHGLCTEGLRNCAAVRSAVRRCGEAHQLQPH